MRAVPSDVLYVPTTKKCACYRSKSEEDCSFLKNVCFPSLFIFHYCDSGELTICCLNRIWLIFFVLKSKINNRVMLGNEFALQKKLNLINFRCSYQLHSLRLHSYMYNCRMIWLSLCFISILSSRKQTHRPRIYIYMYTHRASKPSKAHQISIEKKSRQALFKRPQSKLNNVK